MNTPVGKVSFTDLNNLKTLIMVYSLSKSLYYIMSNRVCIKPLSYSLTAHCIVPHGTYTNGLRSEVEHVTPPQEYLFVTCQNGSTQLHCRGKIPELLV